MADPSGRPAAPGIGELLQIGAMCGVCIGAGMGLGYLLDGVLGTTPLLVFIGLAVGIFVAGVGSYYVIRPFVTRPTDSDVSREASRAKD